MVQERQFNNSVSYDRLKCKALRQVVIGKCMMCRSDGAIYVVKLTANSGLCSVCERKWQSDSMPTLMKLFCASDAVVGYVRRRLF
jgi:hypothetical protein